MTVTTPLKTPRYSDDQARAFLTAQRAQLTDAQRWELDTSPRFHTSWSYMLHDNRVSELQLRAKDMVRYLAHLETDGCGVSEAEVAAIYQRLGAHRGVRHDH
ncbi:hypothetical protein KPL74_11030 [Bacillus sp. NP157]|nr:hypothetical protein KPL74_11030 [Bacillus sp. NP157]